MSSAESYYDIFIKESREGKKKRVGIGKELEFRLFLSKKP